MNNEFISMMTERIVEGFDPLQVILFGSQARGDADPQSDIDLLVVFAELTDKRKTALDIMRALSDLPAAKDIFSGKGWKGPVPRQYNIRSIPAPWLIDREGRLISHSARGTDLERLVAEAVQDKSTD